MRKPTPTRIAPLCLVLLSSACAPAGAPLPPPLPDLPAAILQPCARPTDFLPGGPASQAATEIMAGRIGDALVTCGAEKAALATWARGVAADLGGS